MLNLSTMFKRKRRISIWNRKSWFKSTETIKLVSAIVRFGFQNITLKMIFGTPTAEGVMGLLSAYEICNMYVHIYYMSHYSSALSMDSTGSRSVRYKPHYQPLQKLYLRFIFLFLSQKIFALLEKWCFLRFDGWLYFPFCFGYSEPHS